MSFTRLMENAGSACAREMRESVASSWSSRAGSYASSAERAKRRRRLCYRPQARTRGLNVAVEMRRSASLPPRTQYHARKGCRNRARPEFFWGEENAKNSIESAAVIVDAVFGTGYKYREDERVRAVFEGCQRFARKSRFNRCPERTRKQQRRCAGQLHKSGYHNSRVVHEACPHIKTRARALRRNNNRRNRHR